MPGPFRIICAFWAMVENGEWFGDLKSSYFRFGCGYIIGNVCGLVLGALTVAIMSVRKIIIPFFNYLRATPSVALIPLAIIWFGTGNVAKIFIVAWGVMFPVWLNSFMGIMGVDKQYIEAARSLGLKSFHIYRFIMIPMAMTQIMAGARLGIATGFFGLAAAEMAGAYSGLAFRIFHSHQMFMTDKMMVGILSIGLVAIVTDFLFITIIRLIFPWWEVLLNIYGQKINI